MNRVLLAGLTDREAAAVEIMINMSWRDHQCVVLRRTRGLDLPPQTPQAKACQRAVLDLSGLGLRDSTPDNASRLLSFLDGRSAVLLVGRDSAWLKAALPLGAGQRLDWVASPYSSAELRAALEAIPTTRAAPAPAAPGRGAAHPGRSVAAPAGNAPSGKPPAWRRALQLAERLHAERAAAAPSAVARARAMAPAAASGHAAPASPTPTPGPQAPVGAAPALEPQGAAFDQLLLAMPGLRASRFIHVLARLLQGEGAHLLRMGPASFVIDVSGDWVASSLPVSALLRVLTTPALVEDIQAQPLPADAVEDAAQQHLGGKLHRARKPLELFIWDLASNVLGGMTLHAESDLVFRLLRFPNFTQLEHVGPIDVQLAALCARAPRSIQDLQRTFAHHEQDVLRFVVLSILSGLAGVEPGQPRLAPVVPEHAPPAARRGFFKSLLNKLF